LHAAVPAGVTRASTLDEVYAVIGEFGAFQKRIVIVIAFVSFSTAFNNLGYVFWAARPDFHCVPDERLKTLAAASAASHDGDDVTSPDDDLLLNLTVPWETTADGQYRRSRSLSLPCDNNNEQVYYARRQSNKQTDRETDREREHYKLT